MTSDPRLARYLAAKKREIQAEVRALTAACSEGLSDNAATPTAMRDHIDRLLEAVRARQTPDDALTVWWIEDREASQAISDNELHLPVIREARDYATALHELGHLLGRYQHSGKKLTYERWAWEWARHNALAWTKEMEAAAAASLASYAAR